MTNKHTPLPWVVCDAKRYTGFHIRSDERHWSIGETFHTEGCSNPKLDISEDEAKANADFVTLACNSHYELLDALRSLVNACIRYDEQDEHSALLAANYCAAKDKAIAVIAKAEDKS